MDNIGKMLEKHRSFAESVFLKADKKMSAVALRSKNIIAGGCDDNGKHDPVQYGL
jgi:hypothetical protein